MSTPSGLVRLVAVDNHESALDATGVLAQRHPELVELVATATAVEELDLTVPPPDVVLLDLYLGRDDVPTTSWIPALVDWGARVLLYTAAEFPVPVRQAVAAGASGLVLKNDPSEALLAAIREVAEGGFACSSTVAHALLTDPDLAAALTDRELDVVRGLDDGLTYAQIGRRHQIVADTVKDHLKSVRRKYVSLGRDISNSHSIVREARRDGWLNDR